MSVRRYTIEESKSPATAVTAPGYGRTVEEFDMDNRTCSVDDCGQKVFTRGICGKHYRLWHKDNPTGFCSIPGCDEPIKARNLCSRHYQRWLKENEDWRPKGRPHTPEARAKLSASKRGSENPMYGKTGEAHPNWKGDAVGYFGVHDWMSDNYGQPKYCEHCGTTDPQRRYEWANISGEYRRERSDFKRMCKKCHNEYDQVNAWHIAPSRRNRAMGAIKGKPVSSRYKGVRASGYGTWRATIKVGDKITNLGSFGTEREAALAYNQAVIEAHGCDAFLNEVS